MMNDLKPGGLDLLFKHEAIPDHKVKRCKKIGESVGSRQDSTPEHNLIRLETDSNGQDSCARRNFKLAFFWRVSLMRHVYFLVLDLQRANWGFGITHAYRDMKAANIQLWSSMFVCKF
jgi:hypothetical protein